MALTLVDPLTFARKGSTYRWKAALVSFPPSWLRASQSLVLEQVVVEPRFEELDLRKGLLRASQAERLAKFERFILPFQEGRFLVSEETLYQSQNRCRF